MGATTGTLSHHITTRDLTGALRAVRAGAIDESAGALELTPTATATLGPLVASLRWGALLFGMTFVAVMANDGDLAVVGGLSLVLFLTTWRSTRPLHLGSLRPAHRIVAVTDAAVAGIALGMSHGYASPLAAAAVVPVALAAFGWGALVGAGALASSAVAMGVTTLVRADDLATAANGTGLAIAAAAGVTGLVVRRLCLDAERRRRALHGRIDALSDANELLVVLTQVARTLPNAYNLHDALDRIRLQLTETFGPRQILLVAPGEHDGTWRTELAEGVAVSPLVATDALPPQLAGAAALPRARLAPDGTLVTALRAREHVVGLLLLAAPPERSYGERERGLLDGLADLLALTLDNARWFGRLRSYGAEAERSRIARDLHDRLGQWLTYIGIELERILAHDPLPSDAVPTAERQALERLQQDVQHAMSELRETLRDLRTTVSADRPFAAVASEVLDRFTERSGVPAVLELPTPGARLDVEVEHELLRILQEALHNVDKHAKASHVALRWQVDGARGRLTLTDDGRGFDPQARRDGSYGLVGMQERADGIGATLQITSTPGTGTTLVVETSTESAT